jgi:hypothetical protein
MSKRGPGRGFPRVRILPDNIDGREGVGIPPEKPGKPCDGGKFPHSHRLMAGESQGGLDHSSEPPAGSQDPGKYK